MNPSEKDHLLREILAEDGQLAEFRRDSLTLGLEALRKRRRQRQVLQICLAAALPAALLAAFGIGRVRQPLAPAHQSVNRQPAPLPRPPLAVVAAPPAVRATTPEVKIISDKELFALFPDRPLALIGKPGQQRLVFLDAGNARNDLPPKPRDAHE